MFWCFSCQSQTLPSPCCTSCSSFALQQITPHCNPSEFKPYTIAQQQPSYISLSSLYESALNHLMTRNPQNQPIITRNNNSYQISYVIVVDMGQEQEAKGLTDREIENLERKNIQMECSVCQEFTQEQGIVLECKHQFHQHCLLPWINTNATCPTCRFNIHKE